MASPYKEAVLATSGLVSLWPFDETEGTSATDAKNALNGTYSGSFALNQKSLLPNGEGKSVHFTGGKMEKGDTEKLRLGAGAMSAACWMNADTLVAANYSLWDNTNRGYSNFLHTAANSLLVYFGTSFKTEGIGMELLKETVYHVLFTSSGTKVIIYINGVPVKEDATFTAGATNSNAGVAFAGNPSAGATAFQGYGQYFSIWNTVQSQATAESLYAAGNKSTSPGGGTGYALSKHDPYGTF